MNPENDQEQLDVNPTDTASEVPESDAMKDEAPADTSVEETPSEEIPAEPEA